MGRAQRWRALVDRFGNRLVAANALILTIASWTPGSAMVRSGIFSGHFEHAAAYALSGALIYAVRAGRSTAWQVALMLSAFAGILELGQIFVPGRHASTRNHKSLSRRPLTRRWWTFDLVHMNGSAVLL
jgi:VanZ family protein